MAAVAGAARVAGALAALSLAAYVMVFIADEFGSVRFYSVGEHALVFAYCVACYAACWASWRVWRAAATRQFWKPVVASYGLAAMLTSAQFVLMRLWLGADVRGWGVAANALLVLLLLHSTIAAMWFLRRHLSLRAAAVAGQLAAERAAAQAELRWLQQQIDPHFLFNNLSILSSLMRSDPGQAEVFVQQLTALYRYLVRHNHADWVELDEEIGFARSYVHLLETRFGRAFRVAIELPAGSGFFVVPGLLQELLGNVVKHNHGSEDHPVDVTLRLEGERLVASNALRPKRYAEPRSGRGLATLSERYRLQVGEPLAWHAAGDRFVVTVPLVMGAP
jgi:hypothetical protein